MILGYARVSKSDGSQTTEPQRHALIQAGVPQDHLYEDYASGKKEDRPQLESCLKALREGDTLIVWKLDRLGRDLRHLVNIVHKLMERGVGFKVLTGHGASMDTSTSSGKLIFGIFAALAEFERDLISERTRAGLESARARGRKGGRRFKITTSQWKSFRQFLNGRHTRDGIYFRTVSKVKAALFPFKTILNHEGFNFSISVMIRFLGVVLIQAICV